MNKVRFGVVGMWRGRAWLRTLKLVPRAEVVAICDRFESRRKEGQEITGIGEENAYENLSDMLARDDIDAVAVVVATEVQPDIILEALKAGKHVICEVPLAYSLEDCWRIVLAVEQSGRKFLMAEQQSLTPMAQAWRKMVDEGLLGKPLYGEAQYFHGQPQEKWWRDASTAQALSWEEARGNPNAVKTRYWNICHPIWYTPHSLGPLLQILDDRVVEVTCMATRRQSYYLEEVQNPDVEVALMRTAKDTLLRLATGFNAPNLQHWYHLMGTKGEVETGRGAVGSGQDQASEGLLWLAEHHTYARMPVKWEYTTWQPGDPRATSTGHGGKDYYPMKEFVDHVLDGTPVTVGVYRAAELAGAAVVAGQSADQGSVPMAVPDFRPGPDRGPGEQPA